MSITEPRLTPLAPSEWSEEARALITKISGGRSPLNIFTTLARHPRLLERWLTFANYVLAKNTLPARERELVILRTGWLCRCEYEFHQHRRIGRTAGLTEEEIRRVTEGADAWTGRDATLIRATDELVSDKRISDATWRALEGDLTEQQRIDLLFTVGQYTLVSMVLNTLGVQTEDGSRGFA